MSKKRDYPMQTTRNMLLRRVVLLFTLIAFTACASRHTDVYRDENMDFGGVQTVAVLPFGNLTRDQLAADRVRDVFVTMLLASGSIYVVPQGEIFRGLTLSGVTNAVAPSQEDLVKFAAAVKADAVITGLVREYGELRSGSTSANVISISVQMAEARTGKTVWSASTTKGGVKFKDRLLGGGGEPLNVVTEKAINDILNKLFE